MSEVHLDILRDVSRNLKDIARELDSSTLPSDERLKFLEAGLHFSGRTIEVVRTTVNK